MATECRQKPEPRIAGFTGEADGRNTHGVCSSATLEAGEGFVGIRLHGNTAKRHPPCCFDGDGEVYKGFVLAPSGDGGTL